MRFKRFTIRSGMIAVTMVALFFGYVSWVISSLAPQSRHYCAIFREHQAAVTYEPIKRHRWLHPFLSLEYDTNINGVVLYQDHHDGKTLAKLIPHINAFDECDFLSIQGTSIADDDLSELGQLKNLTSLHLQGSNFSDAGLIYLYELENLKDLDISNTKITSNGLKKFREQLPECGVFADIPVPPIKRNARPGTPGTKAK